MKPGAYKTLSFVLILVCIVVAALVMFATAMPAGQKVIIGVALGAVVWAMVVNIKVINRRMTKYRKNQMEEALNEADSVNQKD